jgi:tRNA-dihydrouridine synthase A
MVGREAYHRPWWLSEWDAEFYDEPARVVSREEVEQQMVDYMEREALAHGVVWTSVARHMLGLRHGLPGARKWRQVWSNHQLRTLAARDVLALAHAVADRL